MQKLLSMQSEFDQNKKIFNMIKQIYLGTTHAFIKV